MNVKEAVQVAKDYAALVFEGEVPRIEEVWFDDGSSEWRVTIGLQRPETTSNADLLLGRRTVSSRVHYKSIRIDDVTKAVKSVRNHETTPVSST